MNKESVDFIYQLCDEHLRRNGLAAVPRINRLISEIEYENLEPMKEEMVKYGTCPKCHGVGCDECAEEKSVITDSVAEGSR